MARGSMGILRQFFFKIIKIKIKNIRIYNLPKASFSLHLYQIHPCKCPATSFLLIFIDSLVSISQFQGSFKTAAQQANKDKDNPS